MAKYSTGESSVDESRDFDPETTDDFSATCRPSGFLFWDCPVEGCIQQYRRYYDLQCHLDKGKHIVKGAKTPLLDKANSMFKNLLENNAQRVPITLQNFNSVQNINRMSTVVLPKGWVLLLPKTKERFIELQKKYLIDVYNNGEETGFKSTTEKFLS
ncbi:unnamed protein product [Rotaria sp. Silwood1]|nr:unnamed protein product [Rotaria sp. Silwood1]